MPSINENLRTWSTYSWEQGGNEWSEVWGGTEYLWHGTLRPRLLPYLPTGTLLEIAPGYGRFTQYLKDLCRRLVLVDLTERCIEACRERFGSDSNIEYHVNDGRSLPMVADASVDFAFSFDSLVHVEADAVESYVGELARVLKPDGVAFLHHSNIAAFADPTSGELPFENRHWRAESMSADIFHGFCEAAGLACVSQEIVNWGCPHLTDCVSVVTPRESRRARPRRVAENPAFMDEAQRLARLAELYRLPGS